MYDWILTHQALIREVINGFCMVLFFVLTILTLIFMWDEWVKADSIKQWQTVPGIPTSCALWWIFAAETYRTGAIWWLYNIGKTYHSSPYPTANNVGIGVFGDAGFFSTFGYLVAGIMLIFGLQRSIYIFTPPQWQRKVWLYATFTAGGFCLLPTFISFVVGFYLNGL